MATTFRQLLQQFDEAATTTTAKGRRFERFCKAYFTTHPYWVAQFDEVWLWEEWPGRTGQDTGIDLVARASGTDELVAVQCKFYKPSSTLSLQHVSSFLSAVADTRFDRGLIVSTAGRVSDHVTSHMDGHAKDIRLLGVDYFETEDPIDWAQFSIEQPDQLVLKQPKELRSHQKQAISDVIDGFADHDRGQMIMACGTGKTFTALRLAEEQVGAGGTVLFLVPSINLLSQSVLAWFADAEVSIAAFAVCSDAQAGRRSDSDMSANDLAFPATTNVDALVRELDAHAEDRKTSMTVIFSTYQSIDVISEAQHAGLGTFDLVICDEAHRTTGASKPGIAEESHFTKVHSNDNVAAARRLYMTATPRIYGDQTKAKANDNDVVLASMDDLATFGPQFHELKFGAAVEQGLLTDYKVVVLAVNEDNIPQAFQSVLTTPDGAELQLSDVAKMVGCWHALSKRGAQFGADDGIPMQRAVAFTSRIDESKQFAAAFPVLVTQANLDRWEDRQAVSIEADHVDGSTSVTVRQNKIAWLEEQPGLQTCRVLSNAKCLTEGVDVPALDAVMFLKPRKSLVDIVQAVGRVMRRHEDKDYGYVILPIGIPAGVEPEEALADNERYRVVWEVLQALRSHDERLAAEIDKINLNKRSSKVNVIGIGIGGGDEPDEPGVTITEDPVDVEQLQIDLPSLDAWREMLYAKIVEKVGSRRYMEQWADDIQQIAEAHKQRIEALLAHPDQNPDAVAHFDAFLDALRENLNDSVGRADAVDMLAQHMITRPIFESLFGHGRFQANNPVSNTMQSMLDELDTANVGAEAKTLDAFYRAIEIRLSDIDTAEGKQTVINNLYEQFFKKALPKAAASLGIVYTPVEVVDFIIRAVDDLLAKHFDGASISDEGVHVLDPFTGTGTFITRMLQSGLIREDDLERKYRSELHANEIMLLAYYIAAANIETAYQHLTETGDEGEYVPFDGIVLADTFSMSEGDGTLENVIFPHNNARADRQKKLDIRVIVGNPPYSIGQTSANDANANLKYPALDATIEETYAAASSSGNVRSLYDSYVRAFRWASNRIQSSPNGGVVGFVSNGGWLDTNAADGLRLTFADEFNHAYVFNLRGNQRTSGEQSRKEGGKVFGSGSRNTVAITLLVKQPSVVPAEGAQLHYRDIGDYLSREEKLEIVGEATIESIEWDRIIPNKEGDWVSQRDPRYDDLFPLAGTDGIFTIQSYGLVTNRDSWVYSSSATILRANVESMASFFNEQVADFESKHPAGTGTMTHRTSQAKKHVKIDPTRHSWTRGHFQRVARGHRINVHNEMFRVGQYRPFFSQHVAFDGALNEMPSKMPVVFPSRSATNTVLTVPRYGDAGLSPFALDEIVDLNFGTGGPVLAYPRWRYEEPSDGDTLFDSDESGRVSNLNPRAVRRFRDALGNDIDDDDVFAYVYGVLHSPQFRETFVVNLKKEDPRVPLVDDRHTFDKFREAGEELLDLHVNYEQVDPFPLVEEWADGSVPDKDPDVLLVGTTKMKYPTAVDPETGKTMRDEDGRVVKNKTRLIYNDHLTLSGIPPEAHEYQLGARSGIDWIIDRWYVTTDSKSGIVNDVNQWGLERNDPRYIVDLIKRVVTVSLRTVEIVNRLPELEFGPAGRPARFLEKSKTSDSPHGELSDAARVSLAAESGPERAGGFMSGP